jgi:hypothetical protein
VSPTDSENISEHLRTSQNSTEIENSQEEKEESRKLWENKFSTLGLANPDKLHRTTSRKKQREPQKEQQPLPTDEDYGDVPGVEVFDCDDPNAAEKLEAWVNENVDNAGDVRYIGDLLKKATSEAQKEAEA